MSNRTYGAFACPKCGNLAGDRSGITRCWYTLRIQAVLGTHLSRVVHEEDSEEADVPKSEEREHFFCGKCEHEWPAEGVEFTVPSVIEREQEVNKQFAALKETHDALLIFPRDFKSGDVVLNLNHLVQLISAETDNRSRQYARWLLANGYSAGFDNELRVMVWRKKESSNANPA